MEHIPQFLTEFTAARTAVIANNGTPSVRTSLENAIYAYEMAAYRIVDGKARELDAPLVTAWRAIELCHTCHDTGTPEGTYRGSECACPSGIALKWRRDNELREEPELRAKPLDPVDDWRFDDVPEYNPDDPAYDYERDPHAAEIGWLT